MRSIALILPLVLALPAAAQTVVETKFPGTMIESRLGGAVAVSGDVAVAGESGSEKARVYRRTPVTGEWVEEAEIQPSGAVVGATLWSNWLATSGNRIVMGITDDGTAVGGAVYVFGYDGSSWVEEAKLVPTFPRPGRTSAAPWTFPIPAT